ncbi:hypothetical protein [Halobacterium rubrum]|uniref:hypothetical protein n=1 Tax=Halobacterium TaxID=2239 RepID=UPI001F2DBA73|nr:MULTISPECIES: hypothetical protein [Halobacterium]MDH5021300.1 hypothetical protein [Halobacterium rubrum]
MATLTHRLSKLALAACLFAFAAGVWVAHRTPATGYELSIYAATPTATWVGVGAALVVGGVLALTASRESRLHDAALVAVGSASLAVFALPLLRGYAYHGGGDALTHLGWARELADGSLAVTELLYPGVHTTSVIVADAAGVGLPRAMLYVVLVAAPVVYLLFVPLTVQVLGGGRRALAVGAIAAAMFVPVNNVSVHPVAHPTSQAILLSAFVFYLLFAYVAAPAAERTASSPAPSGSRSRFGAVTGLGALLAAAAVAFVFVHPQQAVNLAFVFVAVAVLRGLLRYWTTGPATQHRPVYAQTAVLVAALAVWAPRFERVGGATEATFSSLLARGATAGGVVSQRSASLTEVGGSLGELFVKLFLPGAVLSVLTAGLVGVVLYHRFRAHDDALTGYAAASMVPLTGAFVVMFAADLGDQYFRYLGFLMVPVTVLGAAAVGRLADHLDATSGRHVGAVVAVVLLVGMLPVGAMAVHPSPYMYQPNSQVTESEFGGYAATFETREENVPFTGIRGGPRRFVDYHYGTEYTDRQLEFPGDRASIPEGVFAAGNYTTAYEADRYITVTRGAYLREVVMYDGFRYPASGFEAFEATPGVNRVRSNGGYTLYRIETEE